MNKKKYFLTLGVLILIMSMGTFWYLLNTEESIELPVSTETELVLEHTGSTPEPIQGEAPAEATTTPIEEDAKTLPEAKEAVSTIPTSETPKVKSTGEIFNTSAMLLAHNTARAEVGTLPLSWSAKLAESAQS